MIPINGMVVIYGCAVFLFSNEKKMRKKFMGIA
jgi:hypothetical protein